MLVELELTSVGREHKHLSDKAKGIPRVETIQSVLESASLARLKAEDIWICDSGASNHSTWCKKGVRNEQETGSVSIGHTGTAVVVTSTIDVPGQFVAKDGKVGLRAVLTDCSYNPKNNFNLLSLARLINKQGWKVTRGDDTGIQVTHASGSKIDFDIVIPMERGAIYACRFVRNMNEIATVSTDAGTKMSIQRAHCLLGLGSKDATRKTARELGWVLTRGSLKPCEHCAKSKAKQKNVVKESSTEKATVLGHCLYLDLSKITVKAEGGKQCNIN